MADQQEIGEKAIFENVDNEIKEFEMAYPRWKTNIVIYELVRYKIRNIVFWRLIYTSCSKTGNFEITTSSSW